MFTTNYQAKCLFQFLQVSLLSLIIAIGHVNSVNAEDKYSPNHVFAGIEYANNIIDLLIEEKGISNIQIPQSKEVAAKPMHVYELHISTLNELYHYALKNDRRPPPLVTSSPIKYSPTDVYYLTQLLISNLESIYMDLGGEIDFSIQDYSAKTPADVYQELFVLYYKLSRLNNKEKISPNEVYAHIYRAKEDLQFSLLTLSKQLNIDQEHKKRLLVTSIYGMHPDGSTMSTKEKNKNPADVLAKAFEVRNKLNKLREKNNLSVIKIPSIESYSQIKPIDVFLQTQFVIAELNLLKMPMNITSTTNNAKPASNKTPSDVYHEMKHISYMLDRVITTL